MSWCYYELLGATRAGPMPKSQHKTNSVVFGEISCFILLCFLLLLLLYFLKTSFIFIFVFLSLFFVSFFKKEKQRKKEHELG